MRRRNILFGGLGLAMSSVPASAKDLTFVVPSSPGGSSDISGRFLASSMDQMSITVTNRSAGQGVEGTLYVLRSNPDSGILLVGGPNGLFFSPAREVLPYTSNSFEPLCMFSMASFAFVSRIGIFNSIDHMLTVARNNNLNIGFSQSDVKYLIERLAKITNTQLNTIAYRGGGDLARDLLSGVVDVGVLSIASVAGSVQSGALTLLAHTQDAGSVKTYPNLPRLADVIGVNDPALVTYHWHGLYAPKGISESMIRTIQDSARIACAKEKFITDHDIRGMSSRFMDANQLREHHTKMAEYMIGYTNWLKSSYQ